ncbi:DUF3095 domain-containing protein [Mucilaginibacter pallidiroseus]|uniref:DUF3095 domain-containing protein n=1 Tax=Mucilaginibacter pallidiroseus TaxID=2599295 RepID=A0A563UJ27_9SPHI|nr:DUF3095 family protein [Mucilaginibacter pallidiroseus]TWR31341.1 DUF3095 domain-containing protein [Mucilaginibacter pallidiroseus]
MPTKDNRFYTDLPASDLSLCQLFATPGLFADVPDSWSVIITDIKGSTNAILNGRHHDVNLIATGTIVTVLNIVYAADITIPFFFGGDGATFIVPAHIADNVMQALSAFKTNTYNNFKLDLRAGIVSVEDVYKNNAGLHIAKHSISKSFTIPVLLGSGLSYAEQLIKGPQALLSTEVSEIEEFDLTGMQCRWDRIGPPKNKEEIVTLLVVAKNAEQSEAFGKVMDAIDNIYGPLFKRQPISISKLRLNATFARLGIEMRAKLGKVNWLQLIKEWFIMAYGRIYFRTASGRRYLKSLVEAADTLVIDGRINTVISGTVQQRKALQDVLDKLEAEGSITFGMHISNASIMSCYVRNLKDGHIHFVDGSEGGYTQAARMLKSKLNH